MEPADFFKYTTQFPAEYAAASTFAEFAAALDGSKPGPGKLLQHIAATYPETWEPYFATIKTHGFMSRALVMPHAKTVRELFADVSLYPYQMGGYRSDTEYVKAGACFVMGSRAKGFQFFGRLGATYEWSKEWLARGEKLRSVRGGNQWLTAAKPTQELVKAYGAKPGSDDWDLSTFEVVDWADGRRLVIGRCHNGFGVRWIALLNAEETALSMLGDHERGEIEAEEARQKDAYKDDK